jgi:hypothetical protein
MGMKKIAVIFSVCLILGFAVPIYAQVYNPANGHYYELVETELSWSDARDAAAGMSYNGVQGHLATITSPIEESFVVNEWPCIGTDTPTNHGNCGAEARVWFGGTDAATEGDWQWITVEPWGYTDWANGEPNSSGNEDCIEYRDEDGGYWNDDDCDNSRWYLVEYDTARPTSVPTMNEWGMIIFMALAGLGAAYYVRRQRKAEQ